MIADCLRSDNPRIAYRAAKSLSKVVSVFIPRMRNEATEEEQSWHELERGKALDILQARLESGNMSLQPLWKIDRILRSASANGRQTEQIRQRAEVTLSVSVHRPELFGIFDVLCTNEWDDNTPADGVHQRSQSTRGARGSGDCLARDRSPRPRGSGRHDR